MANFSQSFNLVVVGNTGVGKTTFITRHKTGEFVTTYIPTHGYVTATLSFWTNVGKVELTIWDCSGQEQYRQERQQRYKQAHGVILMCDLTSKSSYENLTQWLVEIKSETSCPIVVCGNKVDLYKDRAIPAKEITFPRDHNLRYYDISAKSNYNFEKPFLDLLWQMTLNRNLRFESAPVSALPVSKIAYRKIRTYGTFDETSYETI